jgi:hypothetical protein
MPTCFNAASLQSRMSDVSGSIRKTASGSDTKIAPQTVGEDDIFLLLEDQRMRILPLPSAHSKAWAQTSQQKNQF